MRFLSPIVIVILFANLLRADDHSVSSPDKKTKALFALNDLGQPCLEIQSGEQTLVKCQLGMDFLRPMTIFPRNFGNDPKLRILKSKKSSHDNTYTIPVGKASKARDRHEEMVVSLAVVNDPMLRADIVIRVFDDGVAFRYVLPDPTRAKDLVIADEVTEFTFPGDPQARALPLNSYTTSYEKYYESLPVSKITDKQLIGLPLLLERKASPKWVAVTEAAVTDFPGMYLAGVTGRPGTLVSKLSPLGESAGNGFMNKAIVRIPFISPWRVIMISDRVGSLLESDIIFHLNEPSKIKDTSWIKPGKTTFPWWNGYHLEGVSFKPGVNTETMLHYIDFCAEHGIPNHSLDGLDIAWYGGPISPKGPVDLTTATPAIDLPKVLKHAKDKNVRIRLWMHWKALLPQIDKAFAKYEEWGIEGVMVDFMDRDDQQMVRFYHEIAEKAARHKLTVTLHGAYKPTGMERTWPNVLSYEGVLNQEYGKWQKVSTPPKHNLDAAFVRMIAGPLDYHQGGMRSELPDQFRPRNIAPTVPGTRGQQLAMYVVYQNHMSMLADSPSAYRKQDGLDFLVQVPTSWDETKVVHAEFGRSIVIARRNGNDWYLGGMADGDVKDLKIPLDFLGPGRYRVEWITDDPTRGPTAIKRTKDDVTSKSVGTVTIPHAGGFVGRIWISE